MYKQKIKHFVTSLAMTALLSLSFVTVVPTTAAAAANSLTGCVGGSILTFPCWYKGLPLDSKNTPQIKKLNDIWKIALNLVELLMQLVGYTAVVFIIVGGFKYIKSQGNAQEIANAKSTILNSAIGLAVALSAVAIVNFVGGIIK